MQDEDSDGGPRAAGCDLSNYERSETYSIRARGEGGNCENFIPSPRDVSLPWNDSALDVANRSSQRNIIGEEVLSSSFRAMGNEPLRERRRWLRPHCVEPLGYQQTHAPPPCTCGERAKQSVIDDSRKVPVVCSHSKSLSDVIPLQAQRSSQHHCASVQHHGPEPLQREQCGCLNNSPPVENFVFDDRFQCGNITDSPGAARIPSPSSVSSVTSGRRLEWDSGADVGYQNLQHEEKCSDVGLSTIERIALARGCSAALFERLDPEGTAGSGKKLKRFQGSQISFNSPQAKSTPVYENQYGIKPKPASLKRNEIPSATGQFLLPGGFLYIDSCEERENEGPPLVEDSVAENKEESAAEEMKESGSSPEDFPEDTAGAPIRHSTSLTDLKEVEGNDLQHSLARSQSHISLLTRENRTESSGKESSSLQSASNRRMLGVAYSVSSSSVATIVQKPVLTRKTSDKLIQTLPVKASVGVQTSLTSEDLNSETSVKEDSQSFKDESSASKKISCRSSVSEKTPKEKTSEKVPVEKGTHKCTGAHRKGSIMNGSSCSSSSQNASSRSQITSSAPVLTSEDLKEFVVQKEAKQLSNKSSGTLGSATSSSHTAASSCVAETSYSGTGRHTNFRRESVGVVDSAHSFEYLPGHVYETALEASDSKTKASTSGNSDNKSSSEQRSARSEMSDRESSSNSSPSFSKDIQDGVQLLRDLVSEKSFNPKAKKTLIRQIINRLVDTDYKEDHLRGESDIPGSSHAPLSSGKLQPMTRQERNAGLGSGHPPQVESISCARLEDKERNYVPSRNTSSVSSSLPSGSVSVPGDNEDSTGFSSHSPSDRAGMDWKMATTRSEREFEKARSQSSLNSDSSSLMRFCKTEREKQLHWIRFEINHLNSLKQLLEKQEGLTKSLSKLTAHEHKYHQKLGSKSSRPATCRIQRSEEVETPTFDSSRSGSSACIHCQHKSHLNGSVEMQPSTSAESQEWNTKMLKSSLRHETKASGAVKDRTAMCGKEDAHDVSIQTLTLDSYTISNADAVTQDPKDGQINVYSQTSPTMEHTLVHRESQTSPRTMATQVHKDSQTSLPRAESFHFATKCCCECRKAFEEILEKGVGKQKANEQLQKEKKRNSPQNSSIDSSLSATNLSGSGNNDVTYEEASARTRTTAKSIQTSTSLNTLPITRPAWCMSKEQERGEHRSSKKDGESRHYSEVCPCCGLLIRPAETHKKSSVASKNSTAPPRSQSLQSSQSSNPPSASTKQQSKISSVHDVSAQTELRKSPLAYLLTFEPTAQENVGTGELPEVRIFVPPLVDSNKSESSNSKGANSVAKENFRPLPKRSAASCKLVEVEVAGLEKTHVHSLQEYLEANRPDYLEHADQRSKCLADLAALRELRRQKRRELLAMTARKEATENNKSAQSRPSKCHLSVPKKRPLSKQEMREQAERKYQRSNEVKNKFAERKKKEDFRTNRLMAELFTRKLQKKVLKGVVNHSNTASVISSI